MEKQYHSIFKQIGKNKFYTACNATCTGRIKNGTEFFCGDGVVQYSGNTYSTSKGCGTNGATCKQVTSEYPGPGWTGDASSFPSEACDSDTDTNKLCNLAKGTNYDDYTANSSITCQSDCSKINNADRCARCGNGEKEYGETCEINSSGEIITDDGTYGKSCNSYISGTSWTVPATGKYKITAYGAQGGTGHNGNGPGCNGAKVWGTFELTKGETLYIKVGSKGSNGSGVNGGSGGGGSAVKKGGTSTGKDGTLLIVAGGGGGGGWSNDSGELCSGGQASTAASTSGGINSSYSTPSVGQDGVPGDGSSKGGKGWASAFDFSGGSGGGKDGCSDYAYGGGGGGYTGGSGAWHNDYGGSGAGSYKDSTATDSGWTTAEHAGAGKVEITQIQYKDCSSSCALSSYASCVNN